jgi:hypothetical protein
MQWYPADWRADNGVQSLSFHDRGVWFELLNIMHSTSERGVLAINGAPMSDEMIARLLGLDNQSVNQTLSNLLTYGVAKRRQEDGAVYSKRMVEDEKLSQVRREAGKMGGNPVLLNQNPTTPVNQNPTPSSSLSASSSISETPPTPKGAESIRSRSKSNKLTEPTFPADLPDEKCEVLAEWFQYKKERGQAYTSTGWEVLVRTKGSLPLPRLIAAVEASMSNNHQGIYEPKSNGSNGFTPAPKPSPKGM